MQKRKIEDSDIFEAYNRIMSGESLTAVAKDVGINRGTLRKYIGVIVESKLDEDERAKFGKVINKNFRGNSTENKSKTRHNVKERAAEEINNSTAIKELADYGVTPEQIEGLYKRLRMSPRTAFARDTYIYKYLEHLKVLSELGFSVQEFFDIFMKRPKLFSGNSKKLIEIYNICFQKYGNADVAKRKMIENPWIDLKDKSTIPNSDKTEELYGGGER